MIYLLSYLLMVLMMINTYAEAKTVVVGGASGWSPNVNYTIWQQSLKFYKNDTLLFVYDKNRFTVLQVEKMDYLSCNQSSQVQNWSAGNGRDLVPLNETTQFYFISGEDYCFEGMKVEVDVMDPPPPPSKSNNSGSSLRYVVSLLGVFLVLSFLGDIF
ncbi:hypothetical protein MKX03_023103 [Papaver bracteatum]|nr:hypothetical protein MKX03_023103 [Papaver bracteatum]